GPGRGDLRGVAVPARRRGGGPDRLAGPRRAALPLRRSGPVRPLRLAARVAGGAAGDEDVPGARAAVAAGAGRLGGDGGGRRPAVRLADPRPVGRRDRVPPAPVV